MSGSSTSSIVLRAYQLVILDYVRKLLRSGIKRILLQSPTGSGKTILAAYMLYEAWMRGKVVWFIVHRRELLRQALTKFWDSGIPAGAIGAGFFPDPTAGVQVASIQSLVRRHSNLAPPDLIVWDECFVAGTLVDGTPIEEISVGDIILSFDTLSRRYVRRRVLRTFTRRPSSLTLLRITVGDYSVVCTPNHKFWTSAGWTSAVSLQCDDMVQCITKELTDGDAESTTRSSRSLRKMRESQAVEPREIMPRVSAGWENGGARKATNRYGVLSMSYSNDHFREESHGIQDGWAYLLFGNLFKCLRWANSQRHDEGDECPRPGQVVGEDEIKQSNEVGRGERAAKDHTPGDGMETSGSGRQWQRTNGSSDATRVSIGMADRGSYSDRVLAWCRRLSKSLQTRHWKRHPPDRDRSRWSEPQRIGTESSGSEEGSVLNFKRVDHIEVFEQTSDGTFGGMCPDGLVYNLEVEDTHTYLANGLVVSNCHHLGAKTWSNIHKAYSGAIHIGLSATPARADGQGLGAYFDELVLGPTVSELIADGWLSPYRLFGPPGAPDLSGVRTVAGEFDQHQLDDVMKSTTVVGDAVSEYLAAGTGQTAVAFTWSVASSIELAQRFNDAGVPAAHIDGTTPERFRDLTVNSFRDGQIKVLSNCSIFSEGFDLPLCSEGYFLKPTRSLNVYLQEIGRVLRPAPGKIARLYDHAGNHTRFGSPEEIHRWDLSGREKKAKKKDASDSTKICPGCFLIQPRTARICSNCEHQFLINERAVDLEEGKLSEIDVAKLRKQSRMEQGQAHDLQSLIALGKARGMTGTRVYGWASAILKARAKKEQEAQQRKRERAQPVEDQWLKF